VLKLDSFIGGEKITCPASKKLNKIYSMFMVWAAVCALKQIFCNAYGAIIPVRLEHFSHLVG
jgi:hypothetical protein